ncbi:TPR repeat-containing protein [Chloroherpeton thalassium ATCC 35110]|uniref:TPR repeat-containing protein n=1 Tax=Chloroherpeton thalassium (strain ATCC 35110 / GB-78) TaxID=517418 RepID=B3QY74_CHLT3|nr:tetratricopeptide repeat protein [Chloroherpeton thalassium]ACF15040.1 TPR repeat-containing protein [Chloroherpeton thalassium ATCC 35110]
MMLMIGQISFAQNSPDLVFREGNRLYSRGQYQKALESYNNLLDLGYESGALYYNMGNAYYKLHKTGQAVLYYEKALKLMPDDEDLKNNLELAHLRTQDKISSVPSFFLVDLFNGFLNVFSLGFLGVAVLLSLYLLTAVAILNMRGFFSPLPAKVLMISLVVITLMSSVVFVAKSVQDATESKAVVVTGVVNAKSEPRESSATLFVIHEGLKVDIAQQQGEWVEIKLPDGNKGWIRYTDVGII